MNEDELQKHCNLGKAETESTEDSLSCKHKQPSDTEKLHVELQEPQR